jgi:hypothetical protein
MKVNYTLPGLLPEATVAPVNELGEHPGEAFSLQLQRLRVPEVTDWRVLLRLNAPTAGATGIGPPPMPSGIALRDGASQRAWWRSTLHRHAPPQDQDVDSGSVPVQRMLGLLSESQRREDEIFARHFAERED